MSLYEQLTFSSPREIAMKAKVDPDLCIGCGICIDECKAAAIFFSGTIAEVIEEDCTECGDCATLCVMDAITV